jgi:hypothetical protein
MSGRFKRDFLHLVEQGSVLFGTWLVWAGFKVLRGFVPEMWRHQKVSDKRQLDILRAMFKLEILSGEIKLSADMIPEIKEGVEVINKTFKFSPPLGPDEVFTFLIEVIQEMGKDGLLKKGEGD